MRQVGIGSLVEIMKDFDLLPILNFKYGQMKKLKGWILGIQKTVTQDY
jgi:hypothetical protein